MSEAATNPTQGSDSVQPSDELDNLDDMDLESLLGDDATDQTPAPKPKEIEPKGETDAAPVEPEGLEAEGSEPQPEGQDDAPVIEDKAAVVKLSSGEQVSIAELEAGYMKEADYRLKTQTHATRVREDTARLSETAVRLEQVSNALTQFLEAQIPPEPDIALTYTGNPVDSARYIRETTLRNQAIERVMQIAQAANVPRQEEEKLSQAQMNELKAQEDAALVQRYPKLADQKARDAFLTSAREAAKQLGFEDEVVQGAIDHRQLALAYYASLGLRAEKAQATAKQKVANVPPVSAAPRRAQHPNSAKALQQVNAMKRFNSEPTIANALDLDF